MATSSLPSPLYACLTAHSASRGALVIAFLWGLAEATVFFLVPDIYLGLVALFNWRQGLRATLVTVAGALIGGAIMYALAASNGAVMNQFLSHVPLINADTVNSVAEQMRADGLSALVTGPLQGIPYKVYAAQAGRQGLPLLPFLLITIPARLERILPVALAGAVAGVLFKRFVQKYTRLIVGAYALMWAGIYILYYLRFR